MYNEYKDRVEFLTVYIREAHADDGWRTKPNMDAGIVFNEPTTDAERTEVASVCQTALEIDMPMAIDSIDNDVEEKYISIPMRLFLVDPDGKLAYVGGEGPFGFKPEELDEAIKTMVGSLG